MTEAYTQLNYYHVQPGVVVITAVDVIVVALRLVNVGVADDSERSTQTDRTESLDITNTNNVDEIWITVHTGRLGRRRLLTR